MTNQDVMSKILLEIIGKIEELKELVYQEYEKSMPIQKECICDCHEDYSVFNTVLNRDSRGLLEEYMADIITKIVGKQKVSAITPADLGIVMGGGVLGYALDTVSRGTPQIPPGWLDIIGLILSGAGAFYLKPPWNTLSAGTATGITIGALRLPIGNQAVKVVAKANGIDVVEAGYMIDQHMGMTQARQLAPNSPYVGVIHPNVVYSTGMQGYTTDMMGSGPATGYSVKAPVRNGARYTV